jgi:hypothetical protein
MAVYGRLFRFGFFIYQRLAEGSRNFAIVVRFFLPPPELAAKPRQFARGRRPPRADPMLQTTLGIIPRRRDFVDTLLAAGSAFGNIPRFYQ